MAEHRNESLDTAPSRVSGTSCTFYTFYRCIRSRCLECGQIWDEVLAELRCFQGLMLVLSSSWWLPWNPCVLQSDASLHGWALAHSFWPRETIAQVGRTLERIRFRRVGRHSARESALISALLEVKSDGHWRPRDCLNQPNEAEVWEQETSCEEIPRPLLRRSQWNHVRKGMWRFKDISTLKARATVF